MAWNDRFVHQRLKPVSRVFGGMMYVVSATVGTYPTYAGKHILRIYVSYEPHSKDSSIPTQMGRPFGCGRPNLGILQAEIHMSR